MTSNPLMNIDFADIEVRTLALLGGRSTGKSMLLNELYRAAVETGRSAMLTSARSRMVYIDEWRPALKDCYPPSYLMQLYQHLVDSAVPPPVTVLDMGPKDPHNPHIPSPRYSMPKIDRVGLTLPDRKDDLHTYVQISDSATPSNQSCIAGALASLLRS